MPNCLCGYGSFKCPVHYPTFTGPKCDECGCGWENGTFDEDCACECHYLTLDPPTPAKGADAPRNPETPQGDVMLEDIDCYDLRGCDGECEECSISPEGAKWVRPCDTTCSPGLPEDGLCADGKPYEQIGRAKVGRRSPSKETVNHG